MEDRAPRMGIPAARKPPKTSTMTTRVTGSAIISPRTRSDSTCWLTAADMRWSSETMPWAVALTDRSSPGTWARRASTCSTMSATFSWYSWSSGEETSSPLGSTVTTRRKPSRSLEARTRAAGWSSMPGTTKGSRTFVWPTRDPSSLWTGSSAVATACWVVACEMSTPVTRRLTVCASPVRVEMISSPWADWVPPMVAASVSRRSKSPLPPSPVRARTMSTAASAAQTATTIQASLRRRRASQVSMRSLSHER